MRREIKPFCCAWNDGAPRHGVGRAWRGEEDLCDARERDEAGEDDVKTEEGDERRKAEVAVA